MNRQDPEGWSTKVTRLGDGYGVRVFHHGKLHSEGRADTRAGARVVLKDLLRWVDKLAWDSSMADASRHRRKPRAA